MGYTLHLLTSKEAETTLRESPKVHRIRLPHQMFLLPSGDVLLKYPDKIVMISPTTD